MPEKKLTINIDDVGIHPAVNEALKTLWEMKRIHTCSVIAGGRAADDILHSVAASQGLSVGCHLTLVEESPLLLPEKIPTLISRKTGRFPIDYKPFTVRAFMGKISETEVELELSAQIEKLLRAGIKVSHLDSHQHVHILPQVMPVVIRLAKRYGINKIRIPWDPWRALVEHPGWRAAATATMNLFSRRALVQVTRAGLEPKISVGVVRSGSMDFARVERYMRYLRRFDSDFELIMHPNADEKRFNECYGYWRFKGRAEMDALAHAGLGHVISSGGF